MKLTSTYLRLLASAVFLSSAPVLQSAVLISSGNNLSGSGLTSFSEGAIIAQQFNISLGEWTIDAAQIYLDPIPTEYLGSLSAGIYKDASGVKPTELLGSFGNLTTEGHWTASAPITLSSGSYWLLVSRVGSLPNTVAWKGASPLEITSDSPESLLAFTFGAAARETSSFSWAMVTNGHFPVTISGTGMIPEPGSMALLVAGAVGLVLMRLRKQRDH